MKHHILKVIKYSWKNQVQVEKISKSMKEGSMRIEIMQFFSFSNICSAAFFTILNLKVDKLIIIKRNESDKVPRCNMIMLVWLRDER